MLDFVRRSFRGFINVYLWLSLIACAILGWNAGSRGGIGLAVLGLIIGGGIGLVSNIIFGGFIVTFLEMSENIKQIREDLSYSAEKGGNFKQIQSAQDVEIPKEAPPGGKCINCGVVYPQGSIICANCGTRL